MFATVFGQCDLATPATRAQVVQPGILHDAEHPAREIRVRLELLEMTPGALDPRLHEIVGVVLIARQRAREAAQPRQQLDEAFTDFLRRWSHAFILDDTSGEVIFFRAHAQLHFRGLAVAVRFGTVAPGTTARAAARAAAWRCVA